MFLLKCFKFSQGPLNFGPIFDLVQPTADPGRMGQRHDDCFILFKYLADDVAQRFAFELWQMLLDGDATDGDDDFGPDQGQLSLSPGPT